MGTIGIAILFIILGIVVKYGKMFSLIAGYNTLPEKEKAKYDIEGIASVFRNGMFGMAFILIIGIIWAKWLNNPDIEILATYIAIIIGLPYLVIVSNSKKFKIHKKSE